MEQMILTPNDYKSLANQLNKKIDYLDNDIQTYDIDTYQNNFVIFLNVSISVLENDLQINNVTCFDMDNNIQITSNFDENQFIKLANI